MKNCIESGEKRDRAQSSISNTFYDNLEIKNNVIYEQNVTRQEPYVDKWYTFSNPNGEVLTKQFCRFYVFDGKQTQQLLKNAGFTQEPKIIDDRFCISYK
ncbi:MAG: hypothetical protein ABEI32_00570 [Halothece sp.]